MTQATFSSYEMTDAGIALHFTIDDPGAGRPTEWTVPVSDAEITAVTTLAEFRALVVAKLQRKVQAAGFATKLDPLIGRTVQL